MSQLHIFLICTAVGVAAGPVYDLFDCLRRPFGWKWLRFITDFLFCLAFAGLYLCCAVFLSFPALRGYHIAGCLLGFFLYLKSFHKIVAFFSERVYNRRKHPRKGKRWTKERLQLQK